MSKYIATEKLIAEIERHIKHYEKLDRDDFKNGELYICQELLSFVKSFQQEQPSLPDNLDEAELKYVESLDNPPANQEEERIIYQTFKAGAEWMTKQIK